MSSVTGIVGGLVLTNAPGMDPVAFRKALIGGIASGYATAIGENSPVKLAGGFLVAAVGTAAGDTTQGIVGTFMGCQYTDSQGITQITNWWPASTVATNIIAYYCDNPYVTYSVQADGTVPQTAMGFECDFTNVTVNTTTGLCTGPINSATLVGTGTQRLLRIVGLVPGADNAWGDAYTNVLVQIAKHQYVSAVQGIS